MRHVDLLIAAPADPGAHASWGDVHFARGLQLGLQSQGVGSRLLFRDDHLRSAPPPPDSALLVRWRCLAECNMRRWTERTRSMTSWTKR